MKQLSEDVCVFDVTPYLHFGLEIDICANDM